MSFLATNVIYPVEKAIRLAVRFKVTYDIKSNTFNGAPAAVEKATAALKKFVDKENSLNFRAERDL